MVGWDFIKVALLFSELCQDQTWVYELYEHINEFKRVGMTTHTSHPEYATTLYSVATLHLPDGRVSLDRFITSAAGFLKDCFLLRVTHVSFFHVSSEFGHSADTTALGP